jgi:hypothetical protein
MSTLTWRQKLNWLKAHRAELNPGQAQCLANYRQALKNGCFQGGVSSAVADLYRAVTTAKKEDV